METLGFNSPSLNPENCRLNGDRKSHYVRKIKHVQIVRPFGTEWIFCTKCNFLQVLDLHIFLQKQPGHWHCLYAANAVPMNGAPSSNADKAAFRRLHFHLTFISHICLPNGNGYCAEKPSGSRGFRAHRSRRWTQIWAFASRGRKVLKGMGFDVFRLGS